MITEKLKELGYDYAPTDLATFKHPFLPATRTGNLVFTSGQVSALDDTIYKGRVGDEVNLETAYKAAEICAYNCLRAVGTVADINEVNRVIKVLGMVNVGAGFDNTSGVINGASDLLNKLFEEGHARSAVGMVIPFNFAVEIEMVVELKG